MHLLTQQLALDNRTQAVNPVPYPSSAPPCTEESCGLSDPRVQTSVDSLRVPDLFFGELFLLWSGLSTVVGAHPSLT